MKHEVRQRLSKKGWTDEDFQKVDSALAMHKIKDKSNSREALNKVVYWIGLLIIAVCNFGISIFLVPFLLVFGTLVSSIIIVLMGFVFGILFNYIIQDIEHLERKHHLFAALFIPTISVVNIYVMTKAVNVFDAKLQLGIQHNPLVVSLLYVVAFMIPYIYSMIKR